MQNLLDADRNDWLPLVSYIFCFQIDLRQELAEKFDYPLDLKFGYKSLDLVWLAQIWCLQMRDLSKLDPAIYNQILNLQDNQISPAVLDEDRSGNKKYKILKVTNRYDQHQADFATDYVKIKELALKEKQLDAIQKWMGDKIDDTFVNVNRSYRDCDFSNKWVQ